MQESSRVRIAVQAPVFLNEYGFDTPEDLAASLIEELPKYDVEISYPQGAGGGPEYWIEWARSLIVYVPWDSLNDAAAELLLGSMAGWLLKQIRQRKQTDAETGDRLQGRHHALFPHDATREEKETLLRTTHYRVSIYETPYRPDGLRAIIDIDETTEETRIIRNPLL
jgi:hypothetical protein